MLNVRLAGDHLYGKLLFTWVSLLMSLMVSFCAVFFSRDVLDEIWDLIQLVSQSFHTYSHSWDMLFPPHLSINQITRPNMDTENCYGS